MNEIKSKRYAGLIKQAVELHAEVEFKGWKLAEVIHEAVRELHAEGFVIADRKNKDRMTALRRVAADVGLAGATVERCYFTWNRFPTPDKRDPLLTFNDHIILAGRGGGQGGLTKAALARELHKKRTQQAASPTGRRSPGSVPVVDPLAPYQRFTHARSALKKTLESNIWDYPDREKALAYATELRKLAVELEIKFGGQQLQEAA